MSCSGRMNISVIICCYNSAKRLPQTLRHIREQQTDQAAFWELIIVNNNSTDNTLEVAAAELEKFPLKNTAIVEETNPGLSFARKKGIERSSGQYILFCDDDNWLAPDYLQRSLNIMSADPKIGMLGGMGTAFTDHETPEWFDDFKLTYAVGPQNNGAGDITKTKGYVYGAGAVVRKNALEQVYERGFIHALSDRIGNKLISGGDNEIGYALALIGFKIYYTPDLKFKHYIPMERITKEYLSRMQIGHLYTATAVRTYEHFLFWGTMSYQPPSVKTFKKNFKKLIKVYISHYRKETSDFDFYLQSKRFVGLMKYYLFSKKTDAESFEKVRRNIEMLQKKNN